MRTASYTPVNQLANDDGFDSYARFDSQWRRELDQLQRMANNSGDGRFYYSGWAAGLHCLTSFCRTGKCAILTVV